jgi:8-oxo-dGTP pyrophosphatase MutT (NUDIX family)
MQKPDLEFSRLEHQGRVVQVRTERIRYADGRSYDLDMIYHPGASAVVAVDAENRVCLVRQYRHGVQDFLWEIPAGKLDRGEAPQIAAVRELTEETGVVAKRWESLSFYIPAPGLMTELVHLFLALELSVGSAAPDADEELELCWMPLNEAIDRCLDGRFNDGKTLMGLVRAERFLNPKL